MQARSRTRLGQAALFTRSARLLASAVLVWTLVFPGPLGAQFRGHGAPPTSHNPNTHLGGAPRGVPNRGGGEHLSQWMNRHSNLPLPEQQRALEREPGFGQLSPEVQQRMHNRLSQLNEMSPERRQHVIDRAEAVERLDPQQRQQFRSTMQQLSGLPQDRRRAVSRAFHDYRSLPPQQRAAALQSGQFTNGLSPDERSTFNNLVNVEPYLPPPNRSAGAPQPAQGGSPGEPDR